MSIDESAPKRSASPGLNGYGPDVGGVPETGGTVVRLVTDSHSGNRRTTGLFRRRRSSVTTKINKTDGYFDQGLNGNGAVGDEGNPETSVDMVDLIARNRSPPPKLPELGRANGLLDADDMFKNIR